MIEMTMSNEALSFELFLSGAAVLSKLFTRLVRWTSGLTSCVEV